MLSRGNYTFPKRRETCFVYLLLGGGYILVLEHLPNLRKALGSRKHGGEITYFLNKASLKTLLNGDIAADELSQP